jgi:glutamate synthase (NADPH/NADH) small chain
MRNKVPRQPPKERIKNFFEVALGFSKEEAENEAGRCIQCKNPACVKGCPVEIDIPAFIKLIKEGKRKEALDKIKEKNNLPAVCGRVCPQEDQCEVVCVLNKKKVPINIGALERYAADFGSTEYGVQSTEQNSTVLGTRYSVHKTQYTVHDKIAIIGSGPAGLTCAADLAKMGYQVIIFESLHIPGGVLVYGIPEFRLPKKIVHDEVEYIKSLGVEVKIDTLIGNTYTIEDLFNEGFKAVFIGVGAGLPQFLGIPGENLNRVYSANEFLTRVNLMKAYKFPEYITPLNIGEKVAVIGGGNVAMDCARVALRLRKKSILVYRRTENEMPARREEVENAKEEGVMFNILTQPIKIISDEKGFIKGLECIKMELGAPDESLRRRPVPLKGSNFILDVDPVRNYKSHKKTDISNGVDTVIVAIGQNPNPLLRKVTPGLKTNEDGTIIVDENYITSLPGVFAGGDITSGADTVISAMGAGKKAAVAIDRYIKSGYQGIRKSGNQVKR